MRNIQGGVLGIGAHAHHIMQLTVALVSLPWVAMLVRWAHFDPGDGATGGTRWRVRPKGPRPC